MSFGFRITSFIGRRGIFDEYYVIRTDFDHRMIWTCFACGSLHVGRDARRGHRNPYPTSCYKCGAGHVVCIGGRKWN